MPIPQNKTQLQSFIGLCNYLTCYVPHLSDSLAPLHTYTVKTNEFKWEQVHTDAFETAKKVISRFCTLQYFNSEDPIVIQVNASSIGVDVTLVQHNHVISFHSQALPPTQQHYSNIEHKCYALVNGVEHFHHYLFRHSFEIHTDHQPLVQLTKKPLCEINPRLQCLLLKVTQYI